MDEPLPRHDDEPAARCPIPEWAAWPLAVGLPLLVVLAVLWLLLLR